MLAVQIVQVTAQIGGSQLVATAQRQGLVRVQKTFLESELAGEPEGIVPAHEAPQANPGVHEGFRDEPLRAK